MEWFYVQDNQQKGPVSEEALLTLRDSGGVSPATPVWHEGMSDWEPLAQVLPADSPPGASRIIQIGATADPEAGGETTCRECGLPFPQDQMVPYAGEWVCAECKPLFFQKIQQGVPVRGVFEYGGFWIRFGAKFIDGLIQQGFSMAFGFAIGYGLLRGATGSQAMGGGATIAFMAFSYGFPVLYSTFFLGRFGATLGKMACGLRVVRPDGQPITYLRAFGRHFAEIISSIILLIGYIMAAFDDEKRTLHDRICDTRVVRK